MHIGDLWSSTGALLASATFSGETASGWQQVNFSTPVQIQAGTDLYRLLSHHDGLFLHRLLFHPSGRAYQRFPDRAGNGLDGVYAYGSGPTFPSVSFAKGDNYWVDVVFDDTGRRRPTNPDTGYTVNENGSITIATSTLLANDNPNRLALSFTGVSGAVNGR